MKLITAIVNKYDAGRTAGALSKAGFSFTKIATTGGFLRMGNTTFLLGTEDDMVDDVLDIIRSNSATRMEPTPSYIYSGSATSVYAPINSQISVGGATVFITNVDKFEKM